MVVVAVVLRSAIFVVCGLTMGLVGLGWVCGCRWWGVLGSIFGWLGLGIEERCWGEKVRLESSGEQAKADPETPLSTGIEAIHKSHCRSMSRANHLAPHSRTCVSRATQHPLERLPQARGMIFPVRL